MKLLTLLKYHTIARRRPFYSALPTDLRHRLIGVASIFFFILSFSLFSVSTVKGQRIEGTPGNWNLKTSHDADAKGATEFVVRNLVGQIRITGTDGSRISIVEVIKSQSKNEPLSLQSGRKEALSLVREGTVVRLTGSDERNATYSTSYEIGIPSNLAVRVDVSSGNIEVVSVQSDVRIETGAGNVGMNQISGSVSLRSGSGNITVTEMGGSVVIHTGAGNVSATKINANLNVTTGGGNVTTRTIEGNVRVVTAGGALTATDVKGNTTLFTSGGNIVASNLGGSLEASTSGGEIEVSYVEGRAEVSSNGGGIRASNILGSFRAETMAGDVVLSDIRNSFEIRAEVGNVSVSLADATFLATKDASIDGGYGNITIQLPKEMNGSISAVVTESGSVVYNGAGMGAQLTRERPTVRGEQIRRATYTFGQGGGRISVSTRSGRITISEKN